ncbi:hypothetical protein ACWN8P_08520 [Vagococcus salmoninarum]|uniref:Uncharacterized protein n=1 Tax=Vagococcus salmoninarum TaxID=2739 RepID=A0A429ZLC3_9ENTE|nr:hypothetical protein [Vagococcus salmoninarum]RST94502.1 hypothetical protein CBF35_09625 [Vagococcus salmoninarum]
MVEKFYYRKSKHLLNFCIFTMFTFLAVFFSFYFIKLYGFASDMLYYLIMTSGMAFLGLYGIVYTVKLSRQPLFEVGTQGITYYVKTKKVTVTWSRIETVTFEKKQLAIKLIVGPPLILDCRELSKKGTEVMAVINDFKPEVVKIFNK